MIPTTWSYSPDVAKAAWRRWQQTTVTQATSDAFLAGVRWVVTEAGQQALLREVAALQQRVRALEAAHSMP